MKIFFATAIVLSMAVARTDQPQVGVNEAGGIYTVSATFVVPQTPQAAMAVITDYDHLAEFMPGLRKSGVAARTGPRVTVAQEADAKFLTFSKRIHLLLDIDEAPRTLEFKDRSGKSFVRYEGSWRLSSANGHTVIAYALVAKPAFSVPEFILSRLLKRDSGRMIEALQAEIAKRAR
jgi:carbon monoxide dehydrogenase subunit G